MKKVFVLLLFFVCCVPINISAKAQTQGWINDCKSTHSFLTNDLIQSLTNITNAIAALIKRDKLSKSEQILVKESTNLVRKVTSLSNFACDKLSEDSWLKIKTDQVKEIDKIKSNLDPLLARLNSAKGAEITCYKSGDIKKVTGKNPKCPKGFKKI
jgi:hypothetical protein